MPNDYDAWIGKTEEAEDVIDPGPARRLAATLDRTSLPLENGDPLPPGWHWLYFLPSAPQSELGPDGHPVRGGFLPPVPLPRRMFAGSRIEFHRPARLGDRMTQRSRIADVAAKEGRSGPLVFVTLERQWIGPDGPAITDTQTVVYRAAPGPDEAPPPPQPAPEGAEWRREIVPDPVLLFRYSAVTFNGHRIHYDRRYAMEEEGYPGLVVHGPLLATLLLDLLQRSVPNAVLVRFSFKARRPVFDTGAFAVEGRRDGAGCRLWALDNDGHLAMEAEGAFA